MAKTVVSGVKELDAKFASIEPKIAKKVARKAMRDGAKKIEARAKANLSANGNIDTGELRRGIKVRAMKRSRSRIGVWIATTERKQASKKGFRFGGYQLEYGTKHAQAEPFMRPAGNDSEPAIRSMVIADILEALGELAR
jgi:HK97 gp10 family phage protein